MIKINNNNKYLHAKFGLTKSALIYTSMKDNMDLKVLNV